MLTPTTALTWDLWLRGRRSALLCLTCIASAALLNRIIPDTTHDLFSTVFGILMVFSFAFLMAFLNCTEFNAAGDWNGFPYRLFVLPVPTWKIVGMPMLAGLIAVQSLYYGWVKLVWTHGQFVEPLWYGIVLAAWLAHYQMILWSLAGFRILRTIALSVGGVSGILVVFLPAFGNLYPDSSPWLSTHRLIPVVLATIPAAFIIALIAVSRQRHAGGRRRNWLKALVEWLIDRLPRRTKNFASPAAAQFWFEWRRTGLLLPSATAFALLVVIAPLTFQFRDDASFTIRTLCWALGLPVLLAAVIGKGFGQAELYTASLSIPSFLAVRPMASAEIVAAKLKVAALTVLITWLLVIVFLAAWLPFWANTSELKLFLFELGVFYPGTWKTIIALSVAALAILTWRCMIAELWSGLSGKRLYYFGSIGFQVVFPLLVLIAAAIWHEEIDKFIERNPQFLKFQLIQITGWILAALIIAKLWLAVLTWGNCDPRRARQYVILWIIGTATLTTFAILARPPVDIERQEHIFLLLALFLFPLARVGAAPRFLNMNRSR